MNLFATGGPITFMGDASERELEQRMVDRILDTMRELGPGDWHVAELNLAL